jgi:hypothetical protein
MHIEVPMTDDSLNLTDSPTFRSAKLTSGKIVDAASTAELLSALQGMGRFEPGRLSRLVSLTTDAEVSQAELQAEQDRSQTYVRHGKIDPLVRELLTISPPRLAGKIMLIDDPFDRADAETKRNLEQVEKESQDFAARVVDAAFPRQTGHGER